MTKMIQTTLLMLVVLMTACKAEKEDKNKLDVPKTMLVNGYSQMFQTMSAIKWTDELLLVKINSKEIKDFAGRLDKFANVVGEELKSFEKSEKWLVLDDSGSSEIQKKVLYSMTSERLKSYAPIVGLTGPVFERTMLLVTSGVLNQMTHLTSALLEIEKDKKRIDFLKMAKKSFENLRDEDVKLLNEAYFKHNKFSK